MAIDGIGKGGLPTGAPSAGIPSAGGPEGAGRAGGVGPSRPFEIDPARTGDASRAGGGTGVQQVGNVAASPLEDLRAGRIDLPTYLDRKVDLATAHLEGPGGLPSEQLGAVKAMLRDEIASDPSLAELVRQATGSAPTPPADE